ncbi:MAG: 1-acyl-sn-glycerol-3-phosphate acyltransferase [Halorhodospira halophila]|uniref:lysophospholipid acyltransferase family protein n=1 Tax=Halorhodospira halophila TaxID=1053 RepID=UPI0019113B33|nr:lysophospholipid acyltransferase family protein [Halorhodospira halophila]MBK5936333.1 1-acyl-sn-glycerol-3-phosphate acyltransferase [Halorhodospira halophila]MBK5943578.1 1-acyl-sn-glycerol-3-phosphate acyltransferase [Halorhodospira halophila]MCC3750940.1 1-acyl-sn-glycerol-3-phosphate acyltransferase [Halorhodospira halophila]
MTIKGGTPREWLGSSLHLALMAVTAPIWTVLGLLTYPLGYWSRYRFLSAWGLVVIESARWLCSLDYRVQGLENRPEGAAVVMAKHQSAWETLALLKWFSPQTWVLKESLLRIPFFGWGLRLLEPIAIDRQARGTARQQVIEQGTDRLRRGRWVIIFPEGTRIPPGQKGRYRSGGAELAIRAGVPVVPVAHNAGSFWGRNSPLRRSGRIEVVIGPPVATQGRSAEEITAEVEAWIERQMVELEGRPPDG